MIPSYGRTNLCSKIDSAPLSSLPVQCTYSPICFIQYITLLPVLFLFYILPDILLPDRKFNQFGLSGYAQQTRLLKYSNIFNMCFFVLRFRHTNSLVGTVFANCNVGEEYDSSCVLLTDTVVSKCKKIIQIAID